MSEFGFEGQDIPIDTLYNEEQLLDFALRYLSIEEGDTHIVAEKIVVTYILREYQQQGKESFTEDEVNLRMGQLIAEHVLASLVSKGLVEVNFNENGEPIYNNVDLEGKV